MKFRYKVLLFIALVIAVDQILPRIGDRLIRQRFMDTIRSEIGRVEATVLSRDIPSFSSKKLCKYHELVEFYLYQECFRHYGLIKIDKKEYIEFGFIYFKPKSYFTIFFPARNKHSYYFSESYLGEVILNIATNGSETLVQIGANWESIR